MKTLADYRREYTLGGLRRRDLDPDPMAQFGQWFEDAAGARRPGRARKFCIRLYKAVLMLAGAQPADVNAATLATADRNGRPSARVVLIKGVDERGFVFFTNYDSRKGRELEENPCAALCVYWKELERQVVITGTVTKVPREESEAYFKTRPLGSRLAAWVSRQTEVIENRAVLDERLRHVTGRHPEGDIPLPPNWGGYVVSPRTIEFWQGRPSRLHDRFLYTREGSAWRIDRLAP